MSSRAANLPRRRERLHRVRKDKSYTRARAALRTRWKASDQPPTILVRRAFLHRDSISGDPSAMSQLISPRGHALRLALLMLFMVQTQTGNHRHVLRVPLHAPQTRDLAWADLVVSGAAFGNGTAGRAPRELRAASARNAIDRLARPDVGLVELTSHERRGRYDRLRIMEDSGPRATGEQVHYSFPSRSEAVALPVEFFLNGWIYALEDTEIATYLMYRARCPADGGLARVTAEDREDIYGVKKSAWEQYWVLVDAGILHLEPDPNRRPDGTYIDQGDGARPLPHRFALTDNGLKKDALTEVGRALDDRSS